MDFFGLKIGIIGGSIAGCAVAVLLRQGGAQVSVLERSANPLESRGAGVVLPENFIEQCIQIKLFDPALPRINVNNRRFFIKNA